jgi:hypothetical protein
MHPRAQDGLTVDVEPVHVVAITWHEADDDLVLGLEHAERHLPQVPQRAPIAAEATDRTSVSEGVVVWAGAAVTLPADQAGDGPVLAGMPQHFRMTEVCGKGGKGEYRSARDGYNLCGGGHEMGKMDEWKANRKIYGEQQRAMAKIAPIRWREVQKAARSLDSTSAELDWDANFSRSPNNPSRVLLGGCTATFNQISTEEGTYSYAIAFYVNGTEKSERYEAIPRLPSGISDAQQFLWEVPELAAHLMEDEEVAVAAAEHLIELETERKQVVDSRENQPILGH